MLTSCTAGTAASRRSRPACAACGEAAFTNARAGQPTSISAGVGGAILRVAGSTASASSPFRSASTSPATTSKAFATSWARPRRMRRNLASLSRRRVQALVLHASPSQTTAPGASTAPCQAASSSARTAQGPSEPKTSNSSWMASTSAPSSETATKMSAGPSSGAVRQSG